MAPGNDVAWLGSGNGTVSSVPRDLPPQRLVFRTLFKSLPFSCRPRSCPPRSTYARSVMPWYLRLRSAAFCSSCTMSFGSAVRYSPPRPKASRAAWPMRDSCTRGDMACRGAAHGWVREGNTAQRRRGAARRRKRLRIPLSKARARPRFPHCRALPAPPRGSSRFRAVQTASHSAQRAPRKEMPWYLGGSAADSPQTTTIRTSALPAFQRAAPRSSTTAFS